MRREKERVARIEAFDFNAEIVVEAGKVKIKLVIPSGALTRFPRVATTEFFNFNGIDRAAIGQRYVLGIIFLGDIVTTLDLNVRARQRNAEYINCHRLRPKPAPNPKMRDTGLKPAS